MTAPSISTTGVGGSLFDALSSSVSAYSAQQTIAPFSSLLQQAQTPPAPAPVPTPQPPAPSPPDKQAHDGLPADTSTSSDGSQTAAGGVTNSVADPSQDPASQAQPANAGSPRQDANSPAGRSAATSGHDYTKTRTETNTARATASSTKAGGGQQSTNVDGKAVQTTGQAKLAVQPAKRDGQQQGSGRDDSKSTGKDGPATSSEPAPSVALVDPTAQATQPVVVATAGEKTHSGSDQAATTASGAGSEDPTVLKDSVAAANPNQTLPKGGASPGQSQQPGPGARSTANTASAGTRATAPPQWGVSGFANELTKASDAARVASQTITTTEDATAANGSTTAGQAVATVSATAGQALPTVTVEAGKSTDAPSIPSAGAAAPSAPTTTPAGTSTSNNPLTGPSNPASYAANNSSQSTAASGPNTVDRARFVQRVTRAFQAVGGQGGEIRLRLSPPELGSLQMQISVKDGGITAHIQADNSTAQQLLLESLPDLRDRLAQQDIRIERFDVQLAGQSSGGMPQSPQGNPDFDQTGRRPTVGNNSPAPSAAAETLPAANGSVSITSGALNVVV